MKFNHTLYHYQQDVLKVFHDEIERGDKKIHIVAPPGSGKTIMGLEMISRLDGNHLILVPNLTLQFQWRDKIEKFFLEDGELIDDIVSTSTDTIKKINIITYQSLTSSNSNNDLIMDKILLSWYNDIKNEFNNKEEFDNYIEVLKDLETKAFLEYISKYKKKLKTSKKNNVENILSTKVLDYFKRLKEYKITSIVVDEAHHLTSWWSKVLYYLWNDLGDKGVNPFIIGLTATPPYDDIDFFILDDDYAKLLGEVDYYVPTPAIVKAGRLAPWSDLVYFVEPGDDLKIVLEKIDKKLNIFLKKHGIDICEFIFLYVEKNYDLMIKKSYNRLINYLKFLKNYSDKDISSYFFDEKIGDEILLEDIAKTVGKYLSNLEIKKTSEENIKIINNTKKLFYELGYIWRASNFYKFRTPIENMLVYSKSKINGIKVILDKEIGNLLLDLRCAIITDFLEDRDGIINCKFILKELKKYKSLNPTLVSGQGIWRLGKKGELEELNTNILEVTKQLEEGKINLIIGTRGILGEGWDCPKLNTLIDLTGIVAYMSVNQVRGRAIRSDISNLNKVSNVYDIVTYSKGYMKQVDMYRLTRKHEKFYGVDDSGLIIRGVDHIYPNINKHINDYKNINNNMLKRSTMRDYYYKLWGIGGDYQNKEVFGLDLELTDIGKIIPFVNFRGYDSVYFFKMLGNKNNLEDLTKNSYYHELIRRFLNDFLTNIVKTLIKTGSLPKDFKYELILGTTGNFKLISSYSDELIVKRFILDISQIFSTVTEQKYILKYPFAYYDGKNIKEKFIYFPLPKSLCNNKEIRRMFINGIKNNNLFNLFLIDGSFFLYLPIIFSKRLKSIYNYKKLFYSYISKNRYSDIYNKRYNNKYDCNLNFLYLNGTDIDKSKYIGKKTFIEAKVEKLWI